MTSREYQLVLEFAEDSPEYLDQITALEEKLDSTLFSGMIDGHDVGQGIVNIFIITRNPEQCFDEAMSQIQNTDPKPRAAGYRDLNEEDYIRLLPRGETNPFRLK